MDTIEHLKAAKALIATPDKWCRIYLTDDSGRHCMLGALEAVGFDWSHARTALLVANNIDSVVNFNDLASHEQVMEAFDKAIAYLMPRKTDIEIFRRLLVPGSKIVEPARAE